MKDEVNRVLLKYRNQDCHLVVIGASAGGVDALSEILPVFRKPSMLSVLVVLHLSPDGPNLIPDLLNDRCDFKIKEAESNEDLRPEIIYIAAPDYHLSVEKNKTLSLSSEPEVNFSRPSIDVLFESAAYTHKNKVMAFLLTGANHDGAQGIKLIKEMGGLTIIENPETAECPIMPQAGLNLLEPDLVADINQIKFFIRELNSMERKHGK